MSDDLPRLRPHPTDRFAGAEHRFDLPEVARRLRDEPHPAIDGHRQVALYNEGGLSVILFDFEAQGRLADHAADGYVTIHCLAGAIEVSTVDERHELPAGSLLMLAPGVRHDLFAPQASQMLLTLSRTARA